MDWIVIGKIVNTFGIRGELKIVTDTDFVEERFKVGKKLTLRQGQLEQVHTISSCKPHKGMLIIQFENVMDINQAEQLKGSEVGIDRSELHPLPKGEYYFFQLVNLTVVDMQGVVLGKVIKVEASAAQNLLRIEKVDHQLALVPYTPVFVKEVSLERQEIVIQPIEGLL